MARLRCNEAMSQQVACGLDGGLGGVGRNQRGRVKSRRRPCRSIGRTDPSDDASRGANANEAACSLVSRPDAAKGPAHTLLHKVAVVGGAVLNEAKPGRTGRQSRICRDRPGSRAAQIRRASETRLAVSPTSARGSRREASDRTAWPHRHADSQLSKSRHHGPSARA